MYAKYVKRIFPQTIFRKIKDVGHGGLAPFNPEKFVRGIEFVCGEGSHNCEDFGGQDQMDLILGDVQTTALIPLAIKANETKRKN